MIHCPACKGKKIMIGLGNIEKDCPSCRGVGYINPPSDDLKVTLGDVMKTGKVKKKKHNDGTILHC